MWLPWPAAWVMLHCTYEAVWTGGVWLQECYPFMAKDIFVFQGFPGQPPIGAEDLRVLWFRATAGQSFPEIIYTHQNSSSRQCEISSSTHSSVYNFSKNILDHHHTGAYYCAVAACGKILFSNGALVQLKGLVNPTVFYLGAALGICVIVICAQAIQNCSVRDHDSVVENKPSQDSAAVELNYAAKSLRMKSGRSGDSVYSEVRYFSVTDPNNH
ncbi:uncharacterized protein LOC118806514 [Colossoma macropomum]|uniref:uncharacterized protein LOC118806514 n=1 Tax=Colossoma macropomum TaxID=42526 RepID=UPI001865125D|nr:uncharacterized protein LOC118806514 [Colossoma macropomum]